MLIQEDDEALTEERGAGDGEEENKKVDDDEDRRNPQYIPKKGMFYEHDDRIDSAEEAENAEKTAAETADKKRVPRSENVEKWGHDKFLEREQQPKSKDELVNTYGYDIRNEDSAPRARRRRRYGRGPNKYTRKWEDEDAYELKTGPGGGSTNGAAGGPNKSENNHPSKSHENTTTKSALPKQSDLEEFPPLEQKKNSKNESKISTSKATDSNNRSTTASRGAAGSRGRGGNGNVRGRGGGRHQQADRQSQQAADKKSTRNNAANSANQRLHKEPKPVQSGGQRGQDHHNGKLIDRLEKDFNTKTKLEGSATTTDNKNSKPRMAKDSPRTNRKQMQDQSGEHQQQDNSKPKRYSNTRNRGGGGKSASNSQNNRSQHQDYYEYNGQDNSNKPQQQQQQGAPRYINGNNTSANSPNVSTTAVVPSNFVNMNSGSGPPPAAPFIANTVAAGQPPTSAASGFLDPAAIVNYGPPVQFAPVTVPVTVTVPLVSVPGGGAVPAQPHDSQLPVLAPPLGTPTVTTPDQVLLAMAAAAGQGHAEVRGGVTYFNPTAQIAPMVMARQPVNKRPKAAIPIVDPSQVAPSMSPQSSTEGMEAADQLVVGEHQSVNVT